MFEKEKKNADMNCGDCWERKNISCLCFLKLLDKLDLCLLNKMNFLDIDGLLIVAW